MSYFEWRNLNLSVFIRYINQNWNWILENIIFQWQNNRPSSLVDIISESSAWIDPLADRRIFGQWPAEIQA